MTVKAENEFMTVLQVSRRTGFSRSLIYKKVSSGELPCLRLGKAIRIPRSALETLRAEPKAPPAPADTPPPISPRPRRRAAHADGFRFWPK
jgi:excisionase family DNA binding protein